MIFTRLGQVAVLKMILKYWGQLNFCHFNSVWWKHYLLLFEIQLSNLVPIICLCMCVCVYTNMHVVDAMVWHPETSSCPSSQNLSLWECWLLMVFTSAAFVLGQWPHNATTRMLLCQGFHPVMGDHIQTITSNLLMLSYKGHTSSWQLWSALLVPEHFMGSNYSFVAVLS